MIIEPGQEAYYGHLFHFLQNKVCCVYSLGSPHRGDSYEYTQHSIHFQDKISDLELFQLYYNVCSHVKTILEPQERVRNSYGIRANGVRAIEVSVVVCFIRDSF